MTSRVFTAGWLVAAALFSSWAVSSASDQHPDARRAALVAGADAPAYQLPALSAEVDAEIGRLLARTLVTAPAAAPARNPFSFAIGKTRQRAAAPRADETPAIAHDRALPAVPAPPPPPSLSGIADTGGGALTAVISFHDQLHYVKKGDVIAGRYRVDAVSNDRVDLFDLSVGTILRLSLQRLT